MNKTLQGLIVSSFALAMVAQAQTPQAPTGTVAGTIRDQDRTALAGAEVTLTNLASHEALHRVTSGTGEYAFPEVPTGRYNLTVKAIGMKPATDHQVTVAAGKPVQANVRLVSERFSATVHVTADQDAVTPTIAAKAAISQGSLTARSAQSVVPESFVKEFTNPVSDYSQVIQMTPGVFSYNTNGPGLGQASIFFRGFADGQYTMTFEGIPFQDTNTPTHHSWAFFPGAFLGGAVVDRSPGSATTIGPANFGGSINLLSRTLDPNERFSLDGSAGTWNTSIVTAEYDTGNFGGNGASNFLGNYSHMASDGYQTYNAQAQDALSGKYQYAISQNTQLTAFASYIDVRSNTPSTKGPTRAQAAQYGDNYLLTGDPTQPNYVGYNWYHITTDFEYVGLTSNLGGGWKVDDKLYTYDYHNQENYNSATKISSTSAVDKVNGYRTTGNIFRLSQDSSLGTFRAGLWSELANTDRYQVPSSPLTWVDSPMPNFHETFSTLLLQPFVEYEFKVTSDFKVTPGVKYSTYKQDLTQFADNGKVVGNLGGAPDVKNSARYSTVLPALDLHYQFAQHWSAYAQYATGDTIPPSGVFDVTGAKVATIPDPTKARTTQVGTVYKGAWWTLDFDAYSIKFDNAYSSTTDNNGNTSYFANGTSTTKGVEAESTILLGGGFSLYLNATSGSAKYDATGLWVQNAPKDTEAIALYYQNYDWSIGLMGKRVGTMYQDNGSTHQAVTIDPFFMPNLFINYTLKTPSAKVKQIRLKLSVNNLNDSHAIVGVSPAAATTSVPAPGDYLTILAARSVTFSAGFDF